MGRGQRAEEVKNGQDAHDGSIEPEDADEDGDEVAEFVGTAGVGLESERARGEEDERRQRPGDLIEELCPECSAVRLARGRHRLSIAFLRIFAGY